MKRKIIVIAFFLCCALSAYAESVVGTEYDGNFSRQEFISGASDEYTIRRNFETSMNNTATQKFLGFVDGLFGTKTKTRIVKFFLITNETADMEDIRVVNNIEQYYWNNYNLYDGDMYESLIQRGEKDYWLVLSHITNRDSWLHYMYYVQVEY